jgi:hypothetical protein
VQRPHARIDENSDGAQLLTAAAEKLLRQRGQISVRVFRKGAETARNAFECIVMLAEERYRARAAAAIFGGSALGRTEKMAGVASRCAG